MTLVRSLGKYWDSAVALVAAAYAASCLKSAALNPITTEVIAFFTIQAAVILPAMIFTAGLLRAQGLSLSEVDRYQSALRRQMHFWVTLLCLDLLAVALLILGKAVDWRWQVTVSAYRVDASWILIFAVTFVSALAVLRMYAFIRGVMSLMELNGHLVRRSVDASEKMQTPAPTTSEKLDLPSGYGKILPHPRARRSGTTES
jgi:hypothetical protein